MVNLRLSCQRAATLTIAMLAVTLAHSQQSSFPDKPVRLVVASAAGGAMDLSARQIAQKMTQTLGQPVIVENRPGAGSAVGANMVAKSAPDGHTLLMVSSGYATLPALSPKLPFSFSELTPVAVVVSVPYIFVAPADAPYKSTLEFIAYAKANPGKANFASGGNATGGHLLGTWFKSEAKLNMEHVPYKGEAPALQALLGGQISIMPITMSLGAPLVKAGKLLPLAVSSGKRLAQLPDVPTLLELGVPVQSVVWFGILAPSSVPKEIIARLNAVVNQSLADPALRDTYLGGGMTIEGGSAADFQKLIDRETAVWGPIIKEAGINVN